ncbi:MAG: hypothetical protein FWF97_04375 [Alphaproteobacteria bacterium]|nr:hypothetical protein [Alphaproteobacteria bacterium]
MKKFFWNKLLFVLIPAFGLTFNACGVYRFAEGDKDYYDLGTTYVTKFPNKTVTTTVANGKIVSKVIDDGTYIYNDPRFIARQEKYSSR